jgi:phosphatidylinositol alpha-mannosyltransferase
LDSTDGVQQYVLGLGHWLSGQGHEVHYLVGKTIRKDIANVHSLSRNLPFRFNRNRGSTPLPTSARKVDNLLQEINFDVLHVQVPYSPFMAQRVISRAGKKTAVIGTFHVLPHSQLVMAATRGLGVWLALSLKRFDKMLAVSPAAAEYAAKVFRIQASVLPNMLDYKKFNTAKPLKKYDDGKLTILFLGRLVPRKGCLTLLQSIAELNKNYQDLPEFRVVICGKGPLELKLKKFVADNKLEKYVEFTGFVSEGDKPHYYASADIAVFPSSGGESFGIVLLEALATGTSVVLAGDNPGYRSVLADQPELLFSPRSVDVLASKLANFMANNTARLAKANWGEQFARQFDTPVVGEKLLKIYAQALRKRR